WQAHINKIFYGLKGPAIHGHFQTFVSQDHRLAHALAEDYYQHAIISEKRPEINYVHELGIGNGNLASCFLSHLMEIDRGSMVYPKTCYIPCDYSWEIIKGVKQRTELQRHSGRVSLVQLSAYNLGCFKEQSISKLISNELWDDLSTKVFVKMKADVVEEHLQPRIDRDHLQGIDDLDRFVKDFNASDLERLKDYPPFINNIVWEREYRPVDWTGISCGRIIRTMFKNIDEMIDIPVNVGAIKTIESAYSLLQEGGSYSAFDYGLMNFETLNNPDTECYNIYGGQYTFLVNLPLMERVARFIGFKGVFLERQRHFIQRCLGERMISLVELVETHADFNTIQSWERDLLFLKTMHMLNKKYNSPYKRSIEIIPQEEAPEEARDAIRKLAASLKPDGVPDTVAYISEGEVFSLLNEFVELGYREDRL
ncbi:MAG: hypothetical protein AABZ05_07060, partial [Nitrospirota bacterium]